MGNVKVSGNRVSKTGFKLERGNEIEVFFPEKREKERVEVDFDIDILYEDEYLLVLNKPANLVVHSAPSVKDATLVDWLKSKNYSLSTLSGEERHGIVHRLDKGTTGAMVVAKDNRTHAHLSEQLKTRTMGRIYLAIINSPLKEDRSVEAPIGRNPKDRLKMGIVQNGKYAKTEFQKLQISKNGKEELIRCHLFTGRTHQIRVHLNHIQRYILGDEVYKIGKDKREFPNIFLHAHKLYFEHPEIGKRLEIEAPISQNMSNYFHKNF
jgi:23S rRNA pseudouridine1911/1915/1917 synthase